MTPRRRTGAWHCLVALVPLSVAGAAHADLNLAQVQGCLGCHQVERKLVGPALKEVADRYRGDGEAEERLVRKVREGGKGNWGDILQPPNRTTSDADIRKLVRFILALR